MSDFYELLRKKPSSWFMLLGCNSILVASFMKWSVCLDFLARMLLLGKICWPRAILCFAIVDFSGQYNHITVVFISPRLDGSDHTVHICLVI